jgi:hypothetical protein
MNSYVQTMLDLGREVVEIASGADISNRTVAYKYAEGWRRHLHLGYSAQEIDPLRDALGDHVI